MTPRPFVILFAFVLLQRTLQGINKMRTFLPMQLIPCCLLMWCAGPAARAYLPVPGRAVCRGHDRPSNANWSYTMHPACPRMSINYGLGNLTTMQQLTRLKLEGVGCRRHISLCLKSTSQVNGRGFLVHG